MKPPTKIKLGHRTIKIHFRTGEQDGMFGENFGYTIRETGDIYIRKSDSLEVMQETMLHELLHSILSIYGPRTGHPKNLADYEEWAVSILEIPLIGMLQDNPQLVEYLLAGE